MPTQQDKFNLLLNMSQDVSEVKDLDRLLDRVLTKVRAAFNADAGSIYLKREDKLIFSHTQNDTLQKRLPPDEKLIYHRFTLPVDNSSIAGYVAANNELLNIQDVQRQDGSTPYKFDSEFDTLSNYHTVAMLTVPLTNQRNDVIGVMQLINPQDKNGNIVSFTKDDEPLMQHFATIAALALERAQITRGVILRMVKMAELRDPTETGPHVQRVAGFAVELLDRWARMKNVYSQETEREKDILHMAAMLHDVGKIAVSDTILKKPGRLTDAEFETIKRHPFHGASLFRNRESELDERAAEVALNHHERWDGTGYPGHIDISTGNPVLRLDGQDGRPLPKKGTEIPLSARIVALADVYDALRFSRSYKQAWTEEKAAAEIQKCSGTQFDPDVVQAFLASRNAFRQIAENYPDQPVASSGNTDP